MANRRKAPKTSTRSGFEEAISAGSREQYVLKFYFAGQTSRSAIAFANLKKICEEHLKGRYTIEMVDLVKHPKLAESEQIVAVPTLIKKLPPPLRTLIGDFSNTDKVLIGLNLFPREI